MSSLSPFRGTKGRTTLLLTMYYVCSNFCSVFDHAQCAACMLTVLVASIVFPDFFYRLLGKMPKIACLKIDF